MIDIQYVRNNPDLVVEKSKQKGYSVDVKKIISLDDKRRSLLSETETIRRQRNELVEAAKGRQPSPDEKTKGRELKEQLVTAMESLRETESEFNQALKSVPNMPLDNVPVGSSEEENAIIKTIGNKPEMDFVAKAHNEIGESRELIDKVRAAKIAGSRFAYIRGDLVKLQFAIIAFVISQLTDTAIIGKLIAENQLDLIAKPFIPIIPPAMLKTEPYQASARLNAEEVTYKIEQDDLWLNASAEHTLCTMYMNEILAEKDLPLRYLGYSTSFRREAGTYGKDMEGILRLHQFDKLEMEVFSTPETGLGEHKLMVAIQEHLVKALGLPCQLLNKCTADIGKPNASGYDINTWFPGQGAYRETHTADYMTDYQARDLKIRVRRENGKIELVHTNDATAFALGRIMAAIIENYQQGDGSVAVPVILRPFMNGQERI